MDEVTSSLPCSSCGKPVYEDHRYCAACGTKVARTGRTDRAGIIREFTAGALRSAEHTALELMRKDPVKKVAGGAALGAGVAAFVPFLPMAAGAVFGAAFVGYKMLTKE